MHAFLATAARGLAPLLADELRGLGVEAAEEGHAVAFNASLEGFYGCLLGSRLASRLLLPLAEFALPDADACYHAARGVNWASLFPVGARFAVEFSGRSAQVAHGNFAALRVKDAIADGFREACGSRPDVDREDPDVRVLLQLQGARARLHLDLGQGGLHRRGYRAAGGAAPLRENLAAALLYRMRWPEMAEDDRPFLDPFCGSGTLVIEAALMATRTAPGLLRRWQPRGWLGHDEHAWQAARTEAEAQVRGWKGAPLRGSDRDAETVAVARANARKAGVAACTRFDAGDALECGPAGSAAGLLLANPPYGERVGDSAELVKLYSLLGEHLKRRFGGWRVGLLLAETADSQRLGLRAEARHRFDNGPIACHLLQFAIHEQPAAGPASGGEFANRLGKRHRHLARWARRRGVSCYRVYDADLVDYPLLVDRYRSEDGEEHLHVQEFAAPDTIEPARAEARLRAALSACCEVLEVPPARLHYKLRRPQKAGRQYEAQSDTGTEPVWVIEHGCRLAVDFQRYLDTGLFLDHRPLRLRLQEECRGRRMLNLFCYTGAASVHAAVGGAQQTVSVDLSNSYLEWARQNLAGNGFDARVLDGRSATGAGLPKHALLRDDCLRWLDAASGDAQFRFDRIFCDPPTFSNSRRTEEDFDVQRDHVRLIRACAALLAPGGMLYFSCNRRRFRLDAEALSDLHCEDITPQTLDEDFRRPPPAHRCWRITAA